MAFAEALLRDLTLDYLGTETLAARSLARVTLRRDLQVVRMHGAGLRRLRATAAVVHGPYENTWKWAKALHQHPASVDGIRYRARHDDDGLSLALFDRAEDAIELNGSTPLLETTLAEALAGWLDRYGIGLG